MESNQFNEAEICSNKMITVDPQCAQTYVVKLMIDLRARSLCEIVNRNVLICENENYQKAVNFADTDLKVILQQYAEQNRAFFINAQKINTYSMAMKKSSSNHLPDLHDAIELFTSIISWEDAAEQIIACEEKLSLLEVELEIKKDKNKKTLRKVALTALMIAISITAVIGAISFKTTILPKLNYNKAESLFESAQYDKAYMLYSKLGDYNDSSIKATESLYQQAIMCKSNGNLDTANELFESIKDYKDSAKLIHYHKYTALEIKPATCINAGLKEYHCNCGEEYTEETPTADHNLTEATCTAPSKCTVCDFIASDALGHDTNSGKCGRCGIYYADSTVAPGATSPTTNNTPASSSAKATEMTETVLYNENGIKITALGWTIEKSSMERYNAVHLELMIENNSGTDLEFLEDNSSTSVNGYMTDTYLRADVVNGKKTKTTLRFYTSDLSSCGIATITDVEFVLRYRPQGDYSNTVLTPIMQLKTSYTIG